MPSTDSTNDGLGLSQLAMTIWIGLLAGAWLIATRSATGHFSRPLEPGIAWAAIGSIAALGLLAVLLFQSRHPHTGLTTTPLVATLTLAPTLVSGFALLDLSNITTWIGLTTLAMANLLGTFAALGHRPDRQQHQHNPPVTQTPESNAVVVSDSATLPPAQHAHILSQNLRRHRDCDTDRLEGDLTVHWEIGQKQQPVHVPFVPAFLDTPEVICRCEDDVSLETVRVRIAEVRRFGTRIELKRTGTIDTQHTTRLGFSVTLDISARRAA